MSAQAELFVPEPTAKLCPRCGHPSTQHMDGRCWATVGIVSAPIGSSILSGPITCDCTFELRLEATTGGVA